MSSYIRRLGERGLMDSSVVTMMHAVRGFFRTRYGTPPSPTPSTPVFPCETPRSWPVTQIRGLPSTTTAPDATSTDTASPS